jgi:HSP20 family protein
MATLVRYDHLGNAFDLMNDLTRHWSSMWDDPAPTSFGYGPCWPRVSWREAGEHFELEAEVPGMTEKDVQVSVDQGAISIKGERKPPHALKFARSFTLPTEIDAEKATATVQHGVLTVVLPKAAAAKPRQIEVKAG